MRYPTFDEVKEQLDELPSSSAMKRNFLLDFAAAESESERRRIYGEIRQFAEYQRATRTYQFDPRGFGDGEMPMGYTVPEGSRFGLTLENLRTNAVVMSAIKHGKTTLLGNLCVQLSRNGKTFKVYEFTKGEYRFLRNHIENLYIIAPEVIPGNIFDPPPGVPRSRWHPEVLNVIAHSFKFYHATLAFTQEMFAEVAERKGDAVTLFDLKERLSKEKADSFTRGTYHGVIYTRLQSTLSGLMAGTFATPHGYQLYKLMDKNIVFTLFGYNPLDVELFVNWWLTYFKLLKTFNLEYSERINFNIFDESNAIFPQSHTYSEIERELGPSPLERHLRESRGLNEISLFGLQEPSMIHHSVLAESGLKFLGPLDASSDMELAAASMNLRESEIERTHALPPGYWTVKMRSHEVVTVHVDRLEINRVIDERGLAATMKPLQEEFAKHRALGRDQPQAIPVLSNGELIFVKTISENHFEPKSVIYNLMSGKKSAKVALGQSLVEKRVLRVEKVPLFSSKAMEFFLPTGTGIKLLYQNRFLGADQWYAILKSGTFAHSLIMFHAFRILRQHGKIDREYKIPNSRKQADLYATIEGKRVAIEVAVSPVIDPVHVESCIPSIDAMLIVCLSSDVLASIKRAIESYGIESSKIRYYPNPSSFFADIRSKSTLYHILSIKQTEPNPNSGTQANPNPHTPNRAQNEEKSP